MKTYFVYILASKRNGTLYVGMTSNLVNRVYEHKRKLVKGFTADHNVIRLVWFDSTNDANEAINKERQMEKWKREWKLNLIEESNPNWRDLSLDDFKE